MITFNANAECHNAECCYAERRYAECHLCSVSFILSAVMKSILLIVIMLNVVARYMYQGILKGEVSLYH